MKIAFISANGAYLGEGEMLRSVALYIFAKVLSRFQRDTHWPQSKNKFFCDKFSR